MLHLAGLLAGNFALAIGPWFVRLADSGPVSAAFWRLLLPLPLLGWLAWREREPLAGFGRGTWAALAIAGAVFAFDLASWHLGIERTRLGNATMFGNSGSLLLMIWGLFVARRSPRLAELAAVLFALTGASIMLGRSLEIDRATLTGDLLCILAGLFYVAYLLLIKRAREQFGSWSLLFYSTGAGIPVMLGIAILLGEPVWPHNWGPLIALALGSQVIGQGLLVFTLRHFSALVLGVVLLTQPIVGVIVGWLAFGETMSELDWLGMILVAAALVLTRLGEGQKA
ncbi:DMT family transporter [Novosphingobium sp. Chol11]|uniref:DMT family transporter n=1 Tax=Novosphingobium sp. Chol11 TaxID=1385763 RepID=UPI0025FCA1FD|nr:DMT family transporter [Novosphingobium sp. Chol11]